MSRQRLRVTVRLRSPVVIGHGVDLQNVRLSQDVMPGSLWRGTLGQIVADALGISGRPGAASGSADYSVFRNLFLSDDPIRFGTLLPARWEPSTDGSGLTPFVAPLTAVECKAFPGSRGHGLWDTLKGILEGSPSESLFPGCPACGGRLDRARKFLYRDENGYYDVLVPKRFFVRVGLNRRTETAEEGILYALEAIVPEDPSLGFIGTWTMSEDQKMRLEQYLQPFREGSARGRYRLHIGSARARGMGEVELEWQEDSTSLKESIRTRLDRWNQEVSGGSSLFWTLDVQTPLQLLDRWGRSILCPKPDVLVEALKSYCPDLPESTELVPDATFVESVPVGGWSQVWGLPKPRISMIGPGSVLTFRCASGDRDRLISALTQMEGEGIGERRPEGFGCVLVCSPFHLDRALSATGRG